MQDGEKSLRIWDLHGLDSVHRSGSQLLVHKGGDLLTCSGEAAQAIEWAWQQAPAERKKERYNYTPLLIFSSVVLGILGICLFCYFWLLPWVAERSVGLVPVSTEVAIGEQMSKAYTTGQDFNDSASYYVNRFMRRLSLDSTYPLRAYVIKSPEINAFALPGGNMVVYTGMLEKMSNYEQLAALLGHEITHVTHRHSLRSVFRSMGAGLLISSVFGDITGLSSAVLSQADEFKQLDYSRELETEADENGLQILKRNQIDPEGMLQLLELLKEESTETPALMKYLSTHPDTQARIDHIKAKLETGEGFKKHEELEALFLSAKASLSNPAK